MLRAVDPETVRSLTRSVELLCLDAGNTVVFLDHATVAEVLRGEGFPVSVEALVRAEGEAKRALNTEDAAPALEGFGAHAGWSAMVRTMIERAGISRSDSARCVRSLWAEHDAFNLWRRVPEGLREALHALRAAGVAVCVVSNSEGKLASLFDRLSLTAAFDHVIDSALVGVEKPDPRIFSLALARFGVGPDRALHLGDTVATDVDGARAAGVRAALIDPFGHYEGRFDDVPRVPDVATIAREILRHRA
jgi:HAD superfamily hydrolase (TIGR01509 family)